MRTLNRYLVLSYVGPFLMTFFIAVFVLFMQFLWKYVDDLIGKGLETGTLAELFFYASLTTFPLALPLAILLSSLMTFGNMGEHFELVALKSAGMSLQKIMLPLVLVATLTSFGAFLFANNILPFANLKMRNLIYDIQQKKPALNIKEGVFYNGIEGYTLRIEKKESDGINCSGIMIYDHSKGLGNNKVSISESGKLQLTADKQFLSVVLFNGTNYEEMQDADSEGKYTLVRSKFKEQSVLFDLSGFRMVRTEEDLFKSNYSMLTISQIEEIIDSINITRNARIDEFRKNFSTMMAEDNILKPTEASRATPPDSLHRTIVDLNNRSLPGQRAITVPGKIQTIDMALNLARSKKYYIESLMSEMENYERPVLAMNVEWHEKFSLSLACLILFFVGAPLGAIIRKGGLGMPVVVSVVIFILFFVISIIGKKMAQDGAIPVYIGMWISSAITVPIGIFLTSKATSDSSLFDTDTYLNFFKKLLSKKK
ncbi:MAG: YjgP/YjgQ family permease [Bacteroidetes bacterium]|nr:MAG: YjgP/YjgQ family permease [Bacteroidota bacterium]